MKRQEKTPAGEGGRVKGKRIHARMELADGEMHEVCVTYVSEKRAAVLRRLMGF